MTNRNFDEWLNKFRPSISGYDYYIDFEKVVKNVDEIINTLEEIFNTSDNKNSNKLCKYKFYSWSI